MSKILMVVSAATSITLADGSTHATGVWAEEIVVAHQSLLAAGHEVVIASPRGVAPQIDPGSLSAEVVGDADRVEQFRAYLKKIGALLSTPQDLRTVEPRDFDAVVMPGGHGPMVDLATDEQLGQILTAADDAGIIIAPFCHGPAGLLAAVSSDGSFVFAGRRLAVFSDEEERSGGLGANAPWFVAETLAARGAIVDNGAPWSSHVVRDRNLITGQNPQSSEAVAEAVIEALAE